MQDTTSPLRPGGVAVVLQAVSVAIVCGLPPFLVGAMAVQLRADLDISLAWLGIATAAFFSASGLLARPLGALVQRFGSRRGLALAAMIACLALGLIGTAGSITMLVGALLLGGIGNSIAQPSANLRLSEAIADHRLGLAFGVKQSSIPTATLIGGLAVPGIAVVFGWRWAFAGAAVVALMVAGWSMRGRHSPPTAGVPVRRHDGKRTPRAALIVTTIGAGLAAAASTSLGVFLVDSGVAAGLAPGVSGLLFALCSVLGLSTRIALGAAADRHPGRRHYAVIANMMAGGGIGYLILAAGSVPAFVAGALIGYLAGWSWTGLLHFLVVRDNRAVAASVTGVLQSGLALGAALGPVTFGLIATASSYRAAWLTMAAITLLASATVHLGRRIGRSD